MKINCGSLLVLLLLACRQGHNNQLVIEFEKTFDSIPSASGLAIKGNTAYIVCDDATGIYQINLQDFRQNKIALKNLPFEIYQEPKPIKHDFESACFITWKAKEYLVAFGSGSNSNSRDSLLMLNINETSDQRTISLHEFYRQLQILTKTDSTQWNIEGVTVAGSSMVIVNRGNNLMLVCNVNDLFAFLISSNVPFPQVKHHQLKLPFIGKYEARLSGICTIDENDLLFCASAEATSDWTKDGPVLGSYFGRYSLKDGKLTATYLLKDKQNKPLKEKIESADILQTAANGDLIFLATGDNDNGTSKLFRLRLHAESMKQ